MSEFKNTEQLKGALIEHSGTTAYHGISFTGRMIGTDGFIDFLQKAECFWLATDVEIHFWEQWLKRAKEDPQVEVIRIKVKEGKAEITYEDGNYKVLNRFLVSFTDFPEGEFHWFISPQEINGSIRMLSYLPSEH